MRLDDEQKPLPLLVLILLLFFVAGIALALMGARTPGSALSYGGGGPAVQPYTMVTSWTPTLAAVSDEFTTNTAANWTLQAAGGTGTTLINPRASPSVSLFNFSTFIPGWLVVQAESGTGIAVASKAYTLPTNIAIYSRVAPGKRGPNNNTGADVGDARLGLIFAATSASQADLSNYVECSIQKLVSGNAYRSYVLTRVQGGVETEPAISDRVSATMYGGLDTILMQKRSSTYHCWICRSMSGTCAWLGSTTWGGVATLDRVGILAQNTTTNGPAAMTHRLDFFRIVEADNVLP